MTRRNKQIHARPRVHALPPLGKTPMEQQSWLLNLQVVLGCGHNHIEQLIIFPLVHISSTLILLLFPCSSQSQTLSPLKGGEGRWRREKVSEQGPLS